MASVTAGMGRLGGSSGDSGEGAFHEDLSVAGFTWLALVLNGLLYPIEPGAAGQVGCPRGLVLCNESHSDM